MMIDDAVSRQAVRDAIMKCETMSEDSMDGYIESTTKLEAEIACLPPVKPAISEIDKFNDSVNRSTVLALINDVKNADGFKEYSQYEYLFDQVDKMPMAVPTRKKGKWIFAKTIFDKHGCTVECSSCHKRWKTYDEIRWRKENKFCPNCGAEMESDT